MTIAKGIVLLATMPEIETLMIVMNTDLFVSAAFYQFVDCYTH